MRPSGGRSKQNSEKLDTGTYAPNATYTILTADGGVDGTFDEVTSNFAFLDPTLAYDPNDVFLELVRNEVGFDDVCKTSNRIATGRGVENQGGGDPVFDAAVQLDAPTACDAFDQLSDEIHASAKTVLIEDSRFVREAATNRMRAAFGAVAVPTMPVLSYGPKGPTPVQATTDRFAVWGHGFGSWGKWDGDGNAAKLDRSIGGVFVGADALVGDQWRIGLLTGYSRSNFDVDDRAFSGDSEDYHLGVYGGPEWGALGLRLGAAYTWHDLDTDRSVVFPGFTDRLSGSYDARTAQVFGELGYRIDMAATSFEPFAGVAYVNLDSDGFTEEGGAAALAVDGETTDPTYTTLGVRAAARFEQPSGLVATLRGTLGWRHAFGDVTPLSTHAFAGGDAFTIAGVPIAEDAAVIEAGLDLDLSATTTFGLSYNGQLADDAQDHGLRADLTMKF